MSDGYCVYMHVNRISGVAIYVGAGWRKRPFSGGRTEAWAAAAEGGINIYILADGLSPDEALILEREVINSMRYLENIGYSKSKLVNVMRGGVGRVGSSPRPVAPETDIKKLARRRAIAEQLVRG